MNVALINSAMKKHTNMTKLFAIPFGALALAGLALPVQADDIVSQDSEIEKVKVKDDKVKVKGEDGKVKIKDGKVKLKGDVDEELAVAVEAMTAEQKANLTSNWEVGYTIPADQYIYLTEVPETYTSKLKPLNEGLAYRYFNGTVYTVNPETYAIVDVWVAE